MKQYVSLLKVPLCSMVLAVGMVAFAADPMMSADRNDYAVVADGKPAVVLVDEGDDAGVILAADNLVADLERVSHGKSTRVTKVGNADSVIIAGTLSSRYIAPLLESGKISAAELTGKREKYLLSVVDRPLPGIDRAVVIAGSDKRGAIYGIYELSRQLGVSPWYWMMDVPVRKVKEARIKPGVFTDGEPKVEYRGIFINDEWPAFGKWANEKFGGINAKCYERIFELVLRLKGNYMWPAMWGSAVFDDDPATGPLADRMGIVMGTSHHEPMHLNQQDWKRWPERGAWDYSTNAKGLQEFWRTGIERAKDWEKIVTIGMRGDGDEPMGGGNNRAILERVIADQRQIIADVTGKPTEETPQLWALYKEVLEYYDNGMTVPDDVTLLLCDDNWGNVRRLPPIGAPKRAGGFGMYYHFDYVGAPRNSKWLNCNDIPHVWEQLNLTYCHGVDKLWIVNVGDLKPMEYPIQFFLDMAWDPERFTPENLLDHAVAFCETIVGKDNAPWAARLLTTYAKYARRVTPEQLAHNTFTDNYDEWRRVVGDFNSLRREALVLLDRLPSSARGAYRQLILFPIEAMSNLYNMYYSQHMNLVLADKNDPTANAYADDVERFFRRDAELVKGYHRLNDGKWNHLMCDVHIGYTSWNGPKKNVMPETRRVTQERTSQTTYVPADELKALPPLDRGRQTRYMEKDGQICIEAEHFARKTDGAARWTILPGQGRTRSAVTTLPVDASIEGMSLEYDIETLKDGKATVTLRFSPVLPYNGKGHSYAISIDGQKEKIVTINAREQINTWAKSYVIDSKTYYTLKKGRHTIKIRPLTGGLALQRVLIDLGGLKKSFFGAPENPVPEAGWVGTWATAVEATGERDMPKTTTLANTTLRQVIRVSLGGERLQLCLSNVFGDGDVDVKDVYIADAGEGSRIDADSATRVTFGGKNAFTMKKGASLVSDDIAYRLRPQQRLAVTISFGERVPQHATSHRGSRTNSYIAQGVVGSTETFKPFETVAHWYYLSALNVWTGKDAVAVLGDSITDGRGSTTDAQNRWTDTLSRHLGDGEADEAPRMGVLNLGIGGNSLLKGGLSHPGVLRFDRDILAQRGVSRLIVLIGVNDIAGTREKHEEKCRTLELAYAHLIDRAHVAGIGVWLGTITPMKGNGCFSDEREAMRQRLNAWIRANTTVEGVIDFDELVRDPADTQRLLPRYSQDGLHLTPAGYEAMGAFAAKQLGEGTK